MSTLKQGHQYVANYLGNWWPCIKLGLVYPNVGHLSTDCLEALWSFPNCRQPLIYSPVLCYMEMESYTNHDTLLICRTEKKQIEGFVIEMIYLSNDLTYWGRKIVDILQMIFSYAFLFRYIIFKILGHFYVCPISKKSPFVQTGLMPNRPQALKQWKVSWPTYMRTTMGPFLLTWFKL